MYILFEHIPILTKISAFGMRWKFNFHRMLQYVYIFELPSSCMHNTFHSYKDQPSETLIEESNLRYTSRWITYTTIFVGQTEIDFLCQGCDSMLQALCKDFYVMNLASVLVVVHNISICPAIRCFLRDTK